MSGDLLPDLRRVVTGHDNEGLSSLRSDDRISSSEALPGVRSGPIWATKSTPTNDNNDDVDGATRQPDGDLGLVMHGGTVFRYTDLAPGKTAPMHRTSSLDYNILLVGKLVLVMEDGSETTFDTPGDIVIQRGTIHEWRNPGPGWVRWMTILVDAQPAVVNGQALALDVRL